MNSWNGPVAVEPKLEVMAKEYEVTTGKRVVSWIMAGMARVGLGNFVVLTTKGRKSGQPRSVTVSPISDDEGRYLVSPYGDSGWVLNARADPAVIIMHGGSETRVRLIEVTGEKPELVKAYYEREGFARQFMDVPGQATVADIASVSERFPVFRIEQA
jgi:deazaflavin-dependent oxidoreductase (nitroreductase family)